MFKARIYNFIFLSTLKSKTNKNVVVKRFFVKNFLKAFIYLYANHILIKQNISFFKKYHISPGLQALLVGFWADQKTANFFSAATLYKYMYMYYLHSLSFAFLYYL